MVDYIVTNSVGGFILEGDYLYSMDGQVAVFGGVVGHDPEGGGMLILANGREEYAAYWQVDVDEIADEYDDFGDTWADSGYEDDYSGYYPEDEYFADLDREYDDIY